MRIARSTAMDVLANCFFFQSQTIPPKSPAKIAAAGSQ